MRFLPNKTIDIRDEIGQCPTCARRFSGDAAFCPFDGVALVASVADGRPDPLVGTTIDGRYRVLEVLGEGGMGRVYKVNHLAIERAFAMKVLRRDLARDELLAARFIHEAKATASVEHPNVVQITDFGRLDDATPYFVMELLVGRTLGQVLKWGPLRARPALRILEQVAKAASAAHAAGIVHRDLKPDNVILVGALPNLDRESSDATGPWQERVDVRVVDFGASKVVGASRVTRTGVVFGTPHYMSPEQASGQAVDARADLYALGVIMYEMLTGRLPFEADTYMGVLTKHVFVQPMPPSEVGVANAELGALEAVTLRCLEKNPDDRFASMNELLTSLDAVARGAPLPAWPSPRRVGSLRSLGVAVERASGPPADGAFVGRGAAPPGPHQGRWVWLLIAAAVLFGAVAAGVTAALSRGSPVQSPAAPPEEASARPSSAPSASSAGRPSDGPPPAAPSAAAAASSVDPPRAIPSDSPRRPRSVPTSPMPAHSRAGTPLDDVGDPFAEHR
jgi:serine/threonine protein kinase